jgi:hypothetical protein
MQRITVWKDVMPGDVGFFVGSGFVSEAIRSLSQRQDLGGLPTPSHAALILSRSEVMEALEKTVVRCIEVYKAAFERGDFLLYRPDVPAPIRRAALGEMAKEYKGAAYGWGQIPAFLPVLWVRRKLGIDVPNLLPVGVICSELVLIYLRKCYVGMDSAGLVLLSRALRWSLAIGEETTDPALLMACCQRDAVPLYLSGSPPMRLMEPE